MPAPDLLALTPSAEQGDSIVADFTALGVQDGDVLVWAARSQATVADIVPPSGWARAGVAGTVPTDRFLGIFYKAVPVAATDPLLYTFSGIAGGGNSRIIASHGVLRGADLAHLNDGGAKYEATATLPATTAAAVPYAVFALWGAEYTSGIAATPATIPADFTTEIVAQTAGGSPASVVDNADTTGSRTGMTLLSKSVDSGSLDIPALTPTWAGSPVDTKSASWIVRGLAQTPPIGAPVRLGSGAAARLSYLDGAGARKAPKSVSLWLPGFGDLPTLLGTAGATFAHRGGSLNWPEMSEVAYDRSVRRGYGALEFSCGWTSDLVPFGLGNQYLDEAAGVTGSVDPTTMTWATLESTYQNVLHPVLPGVTQPFYRLEDFLVKYAGSHICLVDPKFGAGDPVKIAAMLDICDAHGGPSRIVIKFDSPITGTDLVSAAKSRGYTTMNYWGTEIAKLTTEYHTDLWDWIGVRYDADQAMYDAAIAIGKPVWAAVIPDQAGYDLAMTRGAGLAMCSNVAGIAPVRA